MRKLLFQTGVILALLAAVGLGMAAADVPAASVGTPIALIPQSAPLNAPPWMYMPTLSWGCADQAYSFRSFFVQGAGVWNLGRFKAAAQPGACPQYFGATFGVAADASEDTSYRITICANACDHPQMVTFTVDQNHARTVVLNLQGAWRLEVQYERLRGFGDAVMIEPQVYF
jgi:hypothetical protein